MTIKEARKFMERIKSHYQEFVIDDFKISEWYGKLKDYDAEDVNAKLDEHLGSEVYGEQIPKVYFLTKYLIPTAEKGKIKHYTIMCQGCGMSVPDVEYEKHFSRCCSAKTIIRDMKKHFNSKIEYQILFEMTDEQFDMTYMKYLYKMLEANIPDYRKKVILKCLYPNNEININEVIKSMTS